MRTTINIDSDLLNDLKRRAAERGSTVSRLIEESVRREAAPAGNDDRALEFELVTYGKDGGFTELDLDHTAAILERDDFERYGKRGH